MEKRSRRLERIAGRSETWGSDAGVRVHALGTTYQGNLTYANLLGVNSLMRISIPRSLLLYMSRSNRYIITLRSMFSIASPKICYLQPATNSC